MIINDAIAMKVLKAIYIAAGGKPATMIRAAQLKSFTDIEAGALHGAIDELQNANLLAYGPTDDRFCLTAAGAACATSC